MNKKTLDVLRFIIPGTMISVTIYYIMNGLFSSTKSPFDNYLFYLLSLVFSVLYYAFNFRDVIWRNIEKTFFLQYISLCFDNIRNDKNIPEPCVSCLFRSRKNKQDESFKANRRLFFELIDTEDVLKEKSQQVMLNGCILTSVIDLALISCAVVLIEVVFYIFHYKFDKTILIICAILIILTPVITYRLTKKHLFLTKSQMKSVKKEWLNEK